MATWLAGTPSRAVTTPIHTYREVYSTKACWGSLPMRQFSKGGGGGGGQGQSLMQENL